MRGTALILITALGVGLGVRAAAQQAPAAGQPAAPALRLMTDAWEEGKDIPLKYTQATVTPVSPPFTWTNVPDGTESFVLHFYDADAAVNKSANTQVHWLVWGIPGTARGLAEAQPHGPQLSDNSRQTSASGQMYRGPGARATGPKHHYIFELYALDTMLDVPRGENEQDTRTKVMEAMNGHVLGKSVYTGMFRRPE